MLKHMSDEEERQHPLEMARQGLRAYFEDASSDTSSATQIAKEFARLLEGDENLAVYSRKSFWTYDPPTGVYRKISHDDLEQILYDLDGIVQPTKAPIKLESPGVKRIIRTLATLMKDVAFFDNTLVGIAVANGFLTLYDGSRELHPHSPCNRARSFIPIPSDEHAQAEQFEKFLSDSFGDAEISELVCELMGVALFGQGSIFQVAAIFLGEGANGKGVLTDIMRKIMRDDALSSVPPHEWKMDYQRNKLDGSLLNTAGELPPIDAAAWEAMKGIIAGDVTTARPVGGNQYDLKPRALHVFSTNQLPKVRSSEESIRRRFRIVRFPYVIPEQERNPHHAQELFDAEKEGILELAVKAYVRLLARGAHAQIANPLACRIEMDRWLQTSDPVRMFVEHQVERTGEPKHRIRSSEMFEAVCTFCNEHRLPPPSSQKTLACRLKDIGLESQKSSTMEWIGVRFSK